MMDEGKIRAKRAVFTRGERLLLIAIVEDHKTVIENKRTDAVTSKQKEEAWLKICSQFNRESTERNLRTGKQLKDCCNQKKMSKKKVATDKVCVCFINFKV